MKFVTTIRKKGTVTIPASVRKAARLAEGDVVEIELTDDGILLKPKKLVDPSQAWFWSPEWQAKEREADEDYAAGRFDRFESDEEFIAELEQRMKRADANT